MGTVGKALDLLDQFSRTRPQLGLSDLARASGVNKATCHRLMSELQARGLVEQIGPAREYRLGPAVLRLASLREAAVPLREAAMPVLRRLAEATGETAHLSHLVAGRLQTFAYAYASRPGVRVMMDDADVLPFDATASGAAVLAYRTDPGPIAAKALDAADVRARLADCRERGWAETVSTFEKDVHGIAVPLFDASGACSGALAVASPSARMTEDLHATITHHLTRAAVEITGQTGGRIPDDIARLWRLGPAPLPTERTKE